jgi:hypothetical protein
VAGPVNAREWVGSTVSRHGSGTDPIRRASESIAVFALGVVLTAAVMGQRTDAPEAAMPLPVPAATDAEAAVPALQGAPSGRNRATTTAGAQYLALYSGVAPKPCLPSILRPSDPRQRLLQVEIIAEVAC